MTASFPHPLERISAPQLRENPRHLSAAYVRSRIDYDALTGRFLWKRDPGKSPGWNTRWAGKDAGFIDSAGYKKITIDDVAFFAHRLAWLIVHGEWPAETIDHISHDRSDNRISNLRSVPFGSNLKNRALRKDNRSGITGVFYSKHHNSWLVQLNDRPGSRKVVGRFSCFDDAVRARDEAYKLYGYHPNHGVDP